METGHSDIGTTLIILGLHEFKNTHICMYQDGPRQAVHN